MISCQDADVLAAAMSVGSLDGPDQTELQSHLAGCADCRRLAGEYLAAAARLPVALEPLRPSLELRSRLMKAVYAEAAAGTSRQSWWRRVWLHVPEGRGFTVLAATAAVAVLAVSSWGLSNTRSPSAPAPRAIALTFMGPAAHAHGQLVYDAAAKQAVLTAGGLPAPASVSSGAAVYEVWLVPASGPPVAAAFLSQGPDGSWTAAMHGDMGPYATVAATVEPTGGSRAPTGAVVLQASLSGA